MINIEDKAKQKRSEEKLEVLKKTLRSYGSVLIAYSGGVDSAFWKSVV